jgi:hypothetical protein
MTNTHVFKIKLKRFGDFLSLKTKPEQNQVTL